MRPLRPGACISDHVIQLLLSRLLNLREMVINGYLTDCLELVRNVVEASYCHIPAPREPLPLGMLTQAHVWASHHTHGMELAILLALLPSLRKLRVSATSPPKPFLSTYQHRIAGVTDITLRSGLT